MEALYNTSVLKLILHIPYINLLQFVFERKYKICIFLSKLSIHCIFVFSMVRRVSNF